MWLSKNNGQEFDLGKNDNAYKKLARNPFICTSNMILYEYKGEEYEYW